MSEDTQTYEFTCLEAIRRLSGVFRPSEAVDRLALICLIIRGMQGDAEADFVKETVLKATGLKLTDLSEGVDDESLR